VLARPSRQPAVLGTVTAFASILPVRARLEHPPHDHARGRVRRVEYFGLLSLLLGPLAIASLFELLNFYRDEYGTPDRTFAPLPTAVSTAGHG
jgi:hypothetical protein